MPRRSLASPVVAVLLAAVATAAAADPTPVFMNLWGSPGSGPGQFLGPYCVATGPDDAVYVTDQGNRRVDKFSRTGTFLFSWGVAGAGPGQFLFPIGICVGPNGKIYVVDQQTARIQIFNANGGLESLFGSRGAGPGQMDDPRDLCSDAAGNIYVADHANARVDKFTSGGGFLGTIGVLRLVAPNAVAVAPDGTIYVTDEGQYVNGVQVFDAAGNFLRLFGAPGSGAGEFNGPGGISLDQYGNVYVADHGNNRVQEFDSAGNFKLTWGTGGSGPGQFRSTLDVAATHNDEIYVVDVGNNRIQRFGFGLTPAPALSWGALKARYRAAAAGD